MLARLGAMLRLLRRVKNQTHPRDPAIIYRHLSAQLSRPGSITGSVRGRLASHLPLHRSSVVGRRQPQPEVKREPILGAGGLK